MKLIQMLCEMVDDEIADAHKYAKCALEYKDTHPNLSKVFFDLSAAEGAFGLQELPQLELPGRRREVDTEVLRRYEFTGSHYPQYFLQLPYRVAWQVHSHRNCFHSSGRSPFSSR